MPVDRRLRLLRFLDIVKKPLDMSTFDKRLILQKIVYLSQEMDVQLGYGYGWYSHGPYSPDLTKNAFELSNLVGSIPLSDVSFEKSAIGGMKKLLAEVDQLPEREEGYWLELLSSLHFIFKYAHPKISSETEAIDRLTKSKPGKFDDEDAKQGFKILHKYKLV